MRSSSTRCKRYVRRHPPTAMTAAQRAQEKRKKKIRTMIATDPPLTDEEVEQLIGIMRRGWVSPRCGPETSAAIRDSATRELALQRVATPALAGTEVHWALLLPRMTLRRRCV